MQKARPIPSDVKKPANLRGGFSLIELVVVLGVLMILIGLILPTVARSVASGRQTGVLSSIQQAAALIEMYCQSSRDTYPLPEGDTIEVLDWPDRLVRAGLLERPEHVDPLGYKRYGRANIALSVCMMYDHTRMHPGLTEPQDQRRPTPVQSSSVLFPVHKGLLWTVTVNDGHSETLWCCGEGKPRGPIAFADGSASLHYNMDMFPNRVVYHENGIGFPVATTWAGVRGRDRQ